MVSLMLRDNARIYEEFWFVITNGQMMWPGKIIDIVTQREITGSLCTQWNKQIGMFYHSATMTLCLFHYLTAPSGLLFGLGRWGCTAASTKAGIRHRVGMVVVVLCLAATILECLYIVQMLVRLHVDAKVAFGGGWVVAYLNGKNYYSNKWHVHEFVTKPGWYLTNDF